MPNESENLLPCPFCGQPARAETMRDPAKVGCFNPACPVKPKASSTCQNNAIDKWNTRPIIAQRRGGAEPEPQNLSDSAPPRENIDPAWISVNDQMPDDMTDVLVACPNSDEPVWLAYHDSDVGWLSIDSFTSLEVTHWRHLPAPPSAISADSAVKKRPCPKCFDPRNMRPHAKDCPRRPA
jgi:hypothetical protein